MSDSWIYAKHTGDEKLARLHHFSVEIEHEGEPLEVAIVVHEYADPPQGDKRFVARAQRRTNQGTTPYRPLGWGANLTEALSDCVREIHRFAFEGEPQAGG